MKKGEKLTESEASILHQRANKFELEFFEGGKKNLDFERKYPKIVNCFWKFFRAKELRDYVKRSRKMDEQVNPKDHKSKRNINPQNHSESKNEKVLLNYNNNLYFIFI